MTKVHFPEVLTLDEAAKYLRLSKETVKRQASQGQIPGRKIDRTWRFSRTALEVWLRGQDGKSALLRQIGAFADDDTLPELLKGIYEQRGRPMTEGSDH